MEMRQVAPPRANPAVPFHFTFGAALLAAAAALHPAEARATSSPAGLGGYQICTTDRFTLAGHEASDPVGGALFAYPTGLRGTGTGQCTKDPAGASGWVNVTYSFGGTDQGLLPCAGDPTSGSYTLTGPFVINDGGASAQTEATLTVTARVVDLWTRSIAVDFDLPDVSMKSAVQAYDIYPPLKSADPELTVNPDLAPALKFVRKTAANLLMMTMDGLLDSLFWVTPGIDPSLGDSGPLYSVGCYTPTIDRLEVAGSFDRLQSLEVDAQALQDAGVPIPDTSRLVESAPIDVTVSEAAGRDIDTDTALGLANVFDVIGGAFDVAPDVPGAPTTADLLAYLVTIKYKTALGSQTMEAVGVPGVRTPMLVPNFNNANIPEQVYVNVGEETGSNGSGEYSLTFDRAGSGPLPIDLMVTVPPVSTLQAVSDTAMQVGFEALSVGGSAPKTLAFRYGRATSDTSKSTSVAVETTSVVASAALDVVGRYQTISTSTDLGLRIHMPVAVQRLKFQSTKTGRKQVVEYSASGPVASIAVSGTEEGKEFGAALTNLSHSAVFCRDNGNGCVMPWRQARCGCAEFGYSEILGVRTPRCVKPRYCPIHADRSASFVARDAGGGYAPVTFNLKVHNPVPDAKSYEAADTLTSVTNLKLAQFGYDSTIATYPKHFYVDTRNQLVSGGYRVNSYNSKGALLRSAAITAEPPGFTAVGRVLAVEEHSTLGLKWYTAATGGSMNCVGHLGIDTGGELPGWVESLISYALCHW